MDFSAASAKVRRRQQEKAAATTRRAPRRNLRLWDLPQYALVTDEASYSSHPVQVVVQAVLQPASSSPRQRRRAHRYAVSLRPVYLHLAISYSSVCCLMCNLIAVSTCYWRIPFFLCQNNSGCTKSGDNISDGSVQVAEEIVENKSFYELHSPTRLCIHGPCLQAFLRRYIQHMEAAVGRLRRSILFTHVRCCIGACLPLEVLHAQLPHHGAPLPHLLLNLCKPAVMHESRQLHKGRTTLSRWSRAARGRPGQAARTEGTMLVAIYFTFFDQSVAC
jgi:hypothetical protein